MAIQFIEIDLKQPIQSLFIQKKTKRLWILAYWGDQPLGWMRINQHIELSLLRERIVRTFSWDLWQKAIASNLVNNNSDRHPFPISVIVCTRDRRISLERCLKSLKQQDYISYEVVIIDNGSSDRSIRDLVVEYGFLYVREDRPGLDWARNRGVQAASHEIIAFIDDDALASPGWLRGIAYGFSDPEIMVVTGLVLPAELKTQAQFDFESYGGMGKGFYRFTIQQNTLRDHQKYWASSLGVGTNMAFRRRLFDIIGDFDVALDVGTPSCGGGDIEFFYRTIDAGCTLRYEPSALVRHFHRKDQKSLNRQIYNNGRSFPNYLLTVARKQPQKRWAVIRFALYHWFWRWLLRRILSGIIRGDVIELRFALIEFWGSLSSLPAYWQSQRTAARLNAQGEKLVYKVDSFIGS
ncbi:MAG TPA: glycosyltransferase [Patescibacteria group bacterium]|nr:glycosyltransferase [Patescibacteria group bacterium]